MPDTLMATAFEILEAVEALPSDERGALVVSHRGMTRGMVLCEHNRVCWASAIGLEHRLRELLRAHGVMTRELLSSGALHAALHDHSIESLIALCGDPGIELGWVPRNGALGATASFEPTDLLAAVGARFYAREAETAATAGVEVADASRGSFALGDDGERVMVRAVHGERLGVTTLTELGSWAAAALDATPGFTVPMIERAVAGADATVAIAWRTGTRVVHAAITEDRALLVHAARELRDHHCPVVVSVRVPWRLRDSTV